MIWSIPKRHFQLILLDGSVDLKERKILSNLNIQYKVEFNAQATVSGAIQEANITIYGLKRETMNKLGTSYTTFTKNQIRNRIELIAGYDNKYAMIFAGNIVEAIPNLDEANYNIQIKAMSSFSTLLETPKSYSFKGETNLSLILSTLAKEYGYSFRNGLSDPVFVQNYSGSDLNLPGHLRKLARITGLDIYLYQNMLIVKRPGDVVKSFKTFVIDQRNMIGSPRPTNVGCDVRVRLDPSVITGQLVNLQTQKFTELNGEKYAVQTITHQCDTKGSAWFTHLNLYRREILEK